MGSQQPPLQAQKAAGIRSEPPPRDAAWQGKRDVKGGPGILGCQKPQSRAVSGARAAVPWLGGEEGYEGTVLQKSAPLDIGHNPTEGVEPAWPVH